jgi:hypothetical protein
MMRSRQYVDSGILTGSGRTDMSNFEKDEADRRETLRVYEDLKSRFIASGGHGASGGLFDGLNLGAAAVRRAEGLVDARARSTRGGVDRPVTEHEVRLALNVLADEAIGALSAGQLGKFRKGLRPRGLPADA